MADEEQHPWIFGLGPERETLLRELNTTDDTPPVPGLEPQNSILGDFTQDSIELIQWYTDCFPQMGNLSQSLNVANNGIILFLQLPRISDIPASFNPCSFCQDYNVRGSLPLTVWNAFPQGPSVLPPEDFTDQHAIHDSFICDVIGPTEAMTPDHIIFPYDCNRPQHGVHLGCYLHRLLIAIDNRQPIPPFEQDACPRCHARTRLAVLQHIACNRYSRRFAFHRLPYISPTGITIIPNQRAYDPSHDYDQVGEDQDIVFCSECESDILERDSSNIITFILRTVAQQMEYDFEMDPAGDVFIDILSLQEILPRDLYHISDFITPFSCPHTMHSGCYFRLIFSQLSLSPADRHPWNEIRCPICRSSLRETILTRFLNRDRLGLGHFPSMFFPSRLGSGSLLPPSSPATFDFGQHNTLLPRQVEIAPPPQ